MICPECGSEYRDGFTRCSDCEVDLIEPPPVVEQPQVELVQVYESGNPALIPIIESVLDDADIEFMTKSENLQDLFAWGRLIGGYNFAIGPVHFLVRSEDADEARELLAHLEDAIPAES